MAGLGERLSGTVLWAGPGSLLLMLIYTMAAAVLMGMPIAGACVVLAAVLAPALATMLVVCYQANYVEMVEATAIALLAAHPFIVYSASWANLTRSVALGVYVACGALENQCCNDQNWPSDLFATLSLCLWS